jgi:twinkle protein
VSGEFLTGEVQALPSRGINEETARKFGYRVGTHHGKPVQIADYRNADGELVAQKIRGRDKQFSMIVDTSTEVPLFGQHLWPTSGRRVVVTEGEIDALSVAQSCGLTWPVVSVPNGAQGARKSVQRALEWLCGYDLVVFCFDMDEPGRKAAAECAALLPPGKAAIAELSAKDPNDMLKAGKVKELSSALWNARKWSPAGIVNGADLWDRIVAVQEPGIPYPWPGLTEKTYGQRKGKLITWTAGSGVGKSTLVSKVAYDLAFEHGLKVGYVALEESVARASQRFLSHRLGKLVHLPGVATEVEMREAFDATLGTGRVFLFDHFGSADSDTLLSKLRYLAVGCECDVLILDHISIAISGLGLDGDERRLIDHMMTELRTMVEETGVLCHVISHLRRSPNDSRSAEEGGRVTLAMLRGSHSIAQLSDQVIAIERDLQGEDRVMTVRVLKNRETGDTGVACHLDYDRETGKIAEVAAPEFEDESGGPDF